MVTTNIRLEIARLKKQYQRVLQLEKQVKREREELEAKLDGFEALQADADDAMRAHLMNGENHADSD